MEGESSTLKLIGKQMKIEILNKSSKLLIKFPSMILLYLLQQWLEKMMWNYDKKKTCKRRGF